MTDKLAAAQRRVSVDSEYSELHNSPSSLSPPIFTSSKTGFLTKRSMSSISAFANWKERFIILKDGTLSYYKPAGKGKRMFRSNSFNSEEFKQASDLVHFKGEVTLTLDTTVMVSSMDDRVNCFGVFTPTQTLHLQAENTNDREEWMDAIMTQITRLEPIVRRQHQGVVPKSNSGERVATDPSYIALTEGMPTTVAPLTQLVTQLLEENQSLRDQLGHSENDILRMEQRISLGKEMTPHPRHHSVGGINVPSGLISSGSDSTAEGKGGKKRLNLTVLDLVDVRKAQFQLWEYASTGDLAPLQTLLAENPLVDVNSKGIDQWTALHLAIGNGHDLVAQALLLRGAGANARTRDDRLTPLLLACRQGSVPGVTLLLSMGSDSSLTDSSGNSCLHMAAEGGHIAVVSLLLAQPDVVLDAVNAAGSLPIHCAPIGHPIRVLMRQEAHAMVDGEEEEEEEHHSSSSHKVTRTKSQIQSVFNCRYGNDLKVGPLDFEFIRVLGRGAFAKVYLVRRQGAHTGGPAFYALKAYNKKAIVQKNQARYIHTEKAALMACSTHPFIVTLHYTFQTHDRLCLVMDYCGGGDLLSALTRARQFSESTTAFYMAQLVLALSHLHSKHIVFRDLKPENVVMDVAGNCLLTDFGISKEGVNADSSASTFCGSPMYLAPEMLSRSGHGPSLDWYSVGALTFELLTGLPPFYTSDKKTLFQNILTSDLALPASFSPAAKSLCRALLSRDPKTRLGSGPTGAREIMTHPFFKDIDWTALLNQKLDPPIVPEIKQPSTATTTTRDQDVPDISNFPVAFTEQVISDAERGILTSEQSSTTSASHTVDPTRSSQHNSHMSRSSSSYRGRESLFKDFDFQPDVLLNQEAEAFEALTIANAKPKSKPKSKIVSAEPLYPTEKDSATMYTL